ncbi:histidinol dehydrogenase, partial [candidate division KSB1 bacterium]|nr:histidinol dehydrogenase [candidate division KSB1 bacterium]
MQYFNIKSLDDIEKLSDLFSGDSVMQDTISNSVRNILQDVKQHGDSACVGYTKKFDGVDLTPQNQEVSADEWQQAAANVDGELCEALEFAAKNIRIFHEKQKHSSWEIERDGVVLGQRIKPIERVGIYVPGGRAKYPSTVLMTALPAHIAGVEEIVMVSPPDKETGTIDSVLLFAAKIAGVKRVFKCGGAQAVAALAYGTETIPRTDKIVGPGNAWVAEAKRQVFGTVGIDLIAGPSEVAILVDANSVTNWVVQDLFAQMEHDPMTRCLVVSLSEEKAQDIIKTLEKQMQTAPRSEILLQAWQGNSFVCFVEKLNHAVEILNRFAPEHLQIMVDKPR